MTFDGVVVRRGWLAARVVALAAVALVGCAAPTGGVPVPAHAGPTVGGGARIPVGFEITPAGAQARLGDLPLNSALSPDGRWLAVSNDGQATQSLQLLDSSTGAVAATVSYPSPAGLYMGLTFSHDGRTLFASGGGSNVIRRYSVDGAHLSEGAPIALPTTNPAGASVNPFPAGITLTPDDDRLLVADQQADALSVVELASGAVHTTAAGHRPLAVVLTADGHSAYVTNQGAGTVSVFDLTGSEPAAQKIIAVGTHPGKAVASADGRTIYVVDGDSDEVSVLDVATAALERTIALAPYPGAAVGSGPDAVAVSADGRQLYVANGGNNDVAVVDLTSFQVIGLIPTGWYPTSLVATPTSLLVTNGKGYGAGPNDGPGHPDPYRRGGRADPGQYSGSMMVGTLSIVGLPLDSSRLADWTAQVTRNDGFPPRPDAGSQDGSDAATSIVPRNRGERSPIQHVIYIVKENRTYDQVLGSLGKGNGEPALDLFGEESAPNARALARAYVTLDNFYADAEVSAQGWNWTVAANSNPYTEQVWAANYSKRHAPYPAESNDPATAPNRDPAQAYIWDRLAAAKVSFRNYGFYLDLNAPGPRFTTQDPVLDAATDHNFRRFDLGCPVKYRGGGTAGGVDVGRCHLRRGVRGHPPALEASRCGCDGAR